MLWISSRDPLQAPNDRDPIHGSRLYLRWQPIRPGKHNHPGFHPKEEVIEYCLSFYLWWICTIIVEDIICKCSWQRVRSPHQGTPLRWKSKSFCLKAFKPYLSDERSSGVYHMGWGLRSLWFTPHPKAKVYIKRSETLSVGARHVDVLPLYLFYAFNTENCHADVKLFCLIFIPKVEVNHVRWTAKPLLYVFMSKSYYSLRPWSTRKECLILPPLRRTDEYWFERYRVHWK